jgi:hypothetical protein
MTSAECVLYLRGLSVLDEDQLTVYRKSFADHFSLDRGDIANEKRNNRRAKQRLSTPREEVTNDDEHEDQNSLQMQRSVLQSVGIGLLHLIVDMFPHICD